jgi:hypothetical protein
MKKTKSYLSVLIVIFTLAFALFLFSCKNKNQINKDVIDKELFTKVLIDLHIADGIIRTANLDRVQGVPDSTSLYNYVFQKNKINRFQFDATVDYYTKHPDDYLKIYTVVIDSFEHMKNAPTALAKEEPKKDPSNLWPLKMNWELPADGERSVIPFYTETSTAGTYVLSASITLFPDDGSVSQRMTIGALYVDGSIDINSNGTLLKSGQPINIEVQITTNQSKQLKAITGRVLDHSDGTEKKHASVSNIELKLIKK